MSERDWEAVARKRVEEKVADTVSCLRDKADQIEREARRNIESAAKNDRDFEFNTYPRVAGQVIHEVQVLLFNLDLDGLVLAAAFAEDACTQRLEELS